MRQVLSGVWVVIFIAGGFVPVLGEPTFEADYHQTWGHREATARTAAERRALAQEVMRSAGGAFEPAKRVFIYHKVHDIAARDRVNYDLAAQALNRMQRIDPDQRLEALLKLERLYAQAYRMTPTQVVLGFGQAETLEQIAEERRMLLEAQLDQGEVDAQAAGTETAKAMASLTQAMRVLHKAVTQTQKYVELAREQAPARVGDFQRMVDRGNQSQQRIDDALTELRQSRVVFVKLRGMQVRFERTADAEAARQLAILLATELDRPQAIPEPVLAAIPEADRKVLRASVRSPNELTGDDLYAMCTWYEQQVPEMITAQGKTVAVTRATFYFDHADRKDHDQARSSLQAMGEQLEEMTGRIEAADALAALEARLDYVAPSQTAAEDTPAPQRPTDGPNDVAKDQTPEAQAEADPTRPADAAPAEQAGNVGGRPMVACNTCGRRFFPGWGATDATQCNRCEEGHENIFDFGDD